MIAEVIDEMFLIQTDPIRSWYDLDAAVSELGEADLAKAQHLAVRVPVGVVQELSGSFVNKAQEIARRLPRVEVFLVWFDPTNESHGMAALRRDTAPEAINDVALLERVRNTEIKRLLMQAGDLPHHVVHKEAFVAPSGRLCDEFFRCANVLISSEAIDTLAFWSLPYLKDVGLILLDTWTISAVAFSMLQQRGVSLPVLGFRAHPFADLAGARNTVSEALRRCEYGKQVLCLASVASTGGFETKVAALFSEEQRADSLIVRYLFSLRDADAGLTSRSQTKLEKPACTAKETELSARPSKIGIDPTLFYPRPSPETSVHLRFEHFGLEKKSKFRFSLDPTQPERTDTPFRSTIARLQSVPGAVKSHVEFGGRCFPYFVDVEALAGNPLFIERASDVLRGSKSSGQWDFIVHARSQPSRALAESLAAKLGSPLYSMTQLEQACRQRASAKMLFVKEAVASGVSLVQDSADIRQASSLAPPARITYLVGVNRGTTSDHNATYNAISTGNEWETELLSVERLPVSSQDRCPWCEELSVLSAAANAFRFTVPDWIERRIGVLSRGGLSSKLLLHVEAESQDPQIGSGSPVFPAGWSSESAALYFAVALQALREDSDLGRRLAPGFFLSQVLSPNAMVNYNEWLLRAMLLRTVPREEWGVDNQKGLVRLLCSYLRDPSVPAFFVHECSLALARGVIVPLLRNDLRPDLIQAAGRHPLPGLDPITLTRSSPEPGEGVSRR